MAGFRILTISEIRETSRGGVRDCQLQELSTGKTYRVGVFLNSQEWSLNVGDEIETNLKKGKPYKNQDTWSCGLDSITPIINSAPKAPSVPVVAPPSEKSPVTTGTDWELRNKKIHRDSLLKDAAPKAVEIYLSLQAQEQKLVLSDVVNLIIEAAEQLEPFIQGDKNEVRTL